jgi:anti-anti-sigma regulatory factor
VELLGQLTGDIGDTLTQAQAKLRGAHIVEIDCARLIRMDMMAASEFLDWVRARRREGRRVRLVGVHRLVGIFLVAMGLDDQADIEWRPL